MKDIFDINQAGEHPSFPDLDPTMHDVGRSRGDDTRFKFPDKYRPAPKNKKQSPANALTDAVISLFKLLGGQAYRINSQGQFDEKQGIWRPSGTKKGIPDVFGCLKGRFITVEIKIGKDRMSEHQMKRKEEIERAGGKFIIARDIEQVKRELL